MRSLKWYKTLHNKKGRLETGYYAVEGLRAVSQTLELSPESVSEILIEDTFASPREIYENLPSRILTARQYQSICAHKTPQGIMAIVRLPDLFVSTNLPDCPGKRVVLLEDIQDPGNMGTLIRTAAALGFDGVIMTSKCADPFGPKAVQASAGSLSALWIRRSDRYLDLMKQLKKNGFTIIAAHTGGQDVWPAGPEDRVVVALGNEGAGVSSQLLDHSDAVYSISIDRNKAESLNVAVAGGICMFKATEA